MLEPAGITKLAAVSPAGGLPSVTVTAPAKPFKRFRVTFTGTVRPCLTETLEGVITNEKSGVLASVTVNSRLIGWERLPLTAFNSSL